MLLLAALAWSAAPGPHAAQLAERGALPPVDRPPIHRTPPPPSTRVRATVYGYHPYWEDDPLDIVDFARLTHLAIFNVDLNSDGTLSDTDRWTEVAGEVVPVAHGYGVKVHVCMTSFEDAVHAAVLPSASKRATTIAELKELVQAYGADGVNIDVEGLDSDLNEAFVAFIQELKAAGVGEVYIATPAVDWNGAFDYSELAESSDGLFIMGYGYHWTGGDPGPNDPLFGSSTWGQYALDWSVQDYLDHDAPADKIVVGLPLYGQEWPVASNSVPTDATGSGWSVSMAEGEQIAASEGGEYDAPSHSPYVRRSGTQLWYPHNDSVRERIAWAVGEGLQGVGFWALGYEGDDPAFWDMVEAETVWTVDDPPKDTGTPAGGDDTASPPGDPDDDAARARVIAGDEHGGGCACATGAGPGSALPALAALLLRRRRAAPGARNA